MNSCCYKWYQICPHKLLNVLTSTALYWCLYFRLSISLIICIFIDLLHIMAPCVRWVVLKTHHHGSSVIMRSRLTQGHAIEWLPKVQLTKSSSVSTDINIILLSGTFAMCLSELNQYSNCNISYGPCSVMRGAKIWGCSQPKLFIYNTWSLIIWKGGDGKRQKVDMTKNWIIPLSLCTISLWEKNLSSSFPREKGEKAQIPWECNLPICQLVFCC